MPFRIHSYPRLDLAFCRPCILAFAMLFAALVLPSWVARAEAQERAWKVTKWSGAVTWTTAAGQTSSSLDGAVIAPAVDEPRAIEQHTSEIQDLVAKQPEEVAQLLRGWIATGR